MQVASNNSMNMGAWTESFLWASMFLGSCGDGLYLPAGWKQKAMMPLFAGIAMSVVAFVVPALPMSLICIGLMWGVWWLAKQGY